MVPRIGIAPSFGQLAATLTPTNAPQLDDERLRLRAWTSNTRHFFLGTGSAQRLHLVSPTQPALAGSSPGH
jgi:hypothetical protein